MQTLEWQSVGKGHHAIAPSALFYDTAIQVPGLLEKCDILRESAMVDVRAVDALLGDLFRLQRTLSGWIGGWEAATIATGRHLKMLRPISHFVHFCTHCPDRTLSRAYHFPSFHVGYMYSLYWMCMHALRTCVQQLASLRCKIDPDWPQRDRFAVSEDELLEYVMELCRCIPFFCEPLSGSIGHIAIFLPMRVAATYFGLRGQMMWLKWIGAVKATVFTQGLSPPIVGRRIFPPTMPTPPDSNAGGSPRPSGYVEASSSSSTSG